MSSYTPLSALEPNAPGGVSAVDTEQYHRVPKAGAAAAAAAVPPQQQQKAAADDDSFIDDIIAELNGTAPAAAPAAAPPKDDSTTIAGIAAATAPAAPPPPSHADGAGATAAEAASHPDYADDAAHPFEAEPDEEGDADAGAPAAELSLYDGEFWSIVARGLRDPIAVAIVVAIVSSPQIQRRLGEFMPRLLGDSIQATLLRAAVAMVLYMGVSRIL